MSIQLTLSGHSFSHTDLPHKSSRDDRTVEIEVATDKCVLVPRPLLHEEQAAAFLHINGIETCDDEKIVIAADESSDIAAVMALPAALLAAADERYGSSVTYTTPLLRTRTSAEPVVWLYSVCRSIYIKVWNGSLRYAEILPLRKPEDVLYYLSSIDRQFGLKAYRIVVSGEAARETAKSIGKYFRNTVCE